MKGTCAILTVATALIFAFSIGACAQKPDSKKFETPKYSIQHPADWKTSDDKGIVNIYPKDDRAAVTISTHSGITFPLEQTKSLILEMNAESESLTEVKMTRLGDVVEFTHESLDKKENRHWFTKVLRKGTELYLITINCAEDVWSARKAGLFGVVDSFTIKS